MPSRDLVFRFLGVDGGAGREFDRMAGKSASLEKAIGTLGLAVAGAGVALGVESVKAAAKFQTAMQLIHTQAGAAQAEVTRMSKAVLALAGPTATAPDSLAAGLYHLESAGFRGQKALLALKTAAEGAKIGGANLEDVTNALNATLVSGIKGAHNMSQAMGALNATVGAGDMRMQDLAEALGTGVLAAVKGFGLSLNDVGAALATFGDNNIRGADAATQLRMAVLFMAKPAASAKATLKELGLTSRTLADDMRKKGLGGALTDLHDHLIKAGDTGAKMGQVLLDLFGHKAGTGIAILEQQYTRFQQKQEQVRTGSKNFASDWTAYTQTFGYSWDRARTAFQTMTIEIGQKLLPTATHAMNWIGTTGVGDLEKFSGWISRNKTPIEDIAKTLALIAGLRFATGKLNDVSRLLGGGKAAAGGLLGGTKVGPVHVWVDNPNFGGKGGPGVVTAGDEAKTGGASFAKTALGDVKNAAKLARAGQIAEAGRTVLQGVARSPIDPLTVIALAVLHKGAIPDYVGRDYQQRLGHSTVQQQRVAATGLMHLRNPSSFPGTGTGAVQSILQYGSGGQLKQLADLAQKNKAVAAALQTVIEHGKTATAGIKGYAAAVAKSANDVDNAKSGLAQFRAGLERQHDAVRKVIAEFRKIPGAMNEIATQAKIDGLSVADAFGSGVVAGLERQKALAAQAAHDLGIATWQSTAKALQVTSPSKRGIYIGRMLAEGLSLGIEQGGRVTIAKAQNLLNGVLGKLSGARGNASGLASGIAGNLTGGASLSNLPLASLTTAFGTSYTAAPTTAGMTSFLSSYLAREKTFARNLAVARKKGLSPVDAGNIAQMGLDVGGPIAAALAGSSAAQVRQVSALDAQITSTANALGSSIAQGQYGAEIARLLKEQNGLLAALAHKTGVEVANAMKSPHSARTLATSHTRAGRAK